jgi:diguanylate cyclase (GGDEF)-like protein
MSVRTLILVNAGAPAADFAPAKSFSLAEAAKEVSRRKGSVSVAVWLPESRAVDARIRSLVRAAGLPSVSVGRSSGPREAERSTRLGFAGHIAGKASARQVEKYLRLLGRARNGIPPSRRAAEAGQRAQRRLKLLADITRAANSVLEPKRVMEIVMAKAQGLIRSEAWSLLLVDEKDQSLSFEISKGAHSAGMKESKLRIGQGIAGWVVQFRRPVIIKEAAKDRRFDSRFDMLSGFRTRSILCVPLLSRGRIIGVVELINKIGGAFTRDDLETLKLLVEPGAVAIENAILYKRSTEMSFTDDLTRLFNSRYLQMALGREIKRARRYGAPVSVIFLDLDGFKNVNDTHGHLAGSRALIEVGEVIRATVREIDVVSRYGGDEFTVVLPQTGPEGAVVIAERIRKSIDERIFLTEMGHEVRLTASFGVSSYPDHGQTREDLIQKADRAMYRVKDNQKNGVALAS